MNPCWTQDKSYCSFSAAERWTTCFWLCSGIVRLEYMKLGKKGIYERLGFVFFPEIILKCPQEFYNVCARDIHWIANDLLGIVFLKVDLLQSRGCDWLIEHWVGKCMNWVEKHFWAKVISSHFPQNKVKSLLKMSRQWHLEGI